MAPVGSIVGYSIAEGVVRPAIVVAQNPPIKADRKTNTEAKPESVNLQVFINGNSDRIGGPIYDTGISNRECNAGLMWRTEVLPGIEKGQWLQLEKV